MKDHEKRNLVTDLTATAVQFHATQQLRARIAHLVLPALEKAAADALAAESSRLAAAVAAVVHDFKASGDTELDELVKQAMRDLCTRMGVKFKA